MKKFIIAMVVLFSMVVAATALIQQYRIEECIVTDLSNFDIVYMDTTGNEWVYADRYNTEKLRDTKKTYKILFKKNKINTIYDDEIVYIWGN